ncbi:MAG: hypothetical protein KatS3mg129_3130 [Leptospiraceae bacterium]|nr:MAG: hypothetical protein KatS3mg129_3130 [Leptospiraceae bacterium]
MSKNLIIFLGVFFILSCKSSLIKKEELEKWNAQLQKEYISLDNIALYEYDFDKKKYITINESILIKKNTKVYLQLEAVDDWLRIRAFDLQKNKKDYLGEVIFYLTVPENKELTSSEIKKIIDDFITMHFNSIN